MEKKYYDLIVSLIKEHKKYPDCEAILEDIVEDVYEHSKVVIGSVTNEDVVSSYLKKVISTSMVTVPKKLNFNTKTRHKVISIDNLAKPSTNTVENNDVFSTNDDREPLLEQDAHSVEYLEEDSSPEFIPNEESFEQELAMPDTTEESENVLPQEEFETLEEFEESDLTESSDKVEEIEDFEEFVEPEDEIKAVEKDVCPTSTVEEVDMTLVDKMINGVSTNNDVNEEVVENTDENEVIYDSLDEVETVEDITPLGNEDESLMGLDPEEDAPDFLQINDTEDIIVEEVQEAEIEELEDATDNIGTVESLELDSELYDQIIEDAPDETELIETSFELEEQIMPEKDNADEQLEHTVDAEESRNASSEEFIPPSYDCFNYEPDIIEPDVTEIFASLEEIDEKHPEKQIIKVCDLKYNQKLSVPEIAEILNFTEDDVIEVLSEIIYVVKD